ncbi:hypothetical protein THAOC_07378, partial [Thalassiosira oceanica]
MFGRIAPPSPRERGTPTPARRGRREGELEARGWAKLGWAAGLGGTGRPCRIVWAMAVGKTLPDRKDSNLAKILTFLPFPPSGASSGETADPKHSPTNAEGATGL